MYDIPIPDEPADRSVVLDRDSVAWQRRDDLVVERPANPDLRWFRVGVLSTLFGRTNGRTWRHLLVDLGPLAPMVAESAVEDVVETRPPSGGRSIPVGFP